MPSTRVISAVSAFERGVRKVKRVPQTFLFSLVFDFLSSPFLGIARESESAVTAKASDFFAPKQESTYWTRKKLGKMKEKKITVYNKNGGNGGKVGPFGRRDSSKR